MTSKPALTRLAAIGPPMMPRTTKLTVVIAVLLAGAAFARRSSGSAARVRGGRGSDGVALLAGQPGEAVVARPAGLVLEPDPAVVAGGGEPGQVAVEVEGAGAGLVAPGGVGDLDVGDTVGVGGDHLVEVVAVGGQVVEVAEEAEVADTGLALDPVDHPDGVGGGQRRRGRGPRWPAGPGRPGRLRRPGCRTGR